MREFVEELFDDEGISGREARRIVFGDLDDLYGPVGKRFRSTVYHPRRYKILYLGTVIDPVNLKPEALTVLMLHEGYLYSVCGRDLAPSWETDAGAIQLSEFSVERLTFFINSLDLVPTAKAHLIMVKKHFEYLLEELDGI